MSDSLWPHGLQHARIPCLSLCSRVYGQATIANSSVQFSHSVLSDSLWPHGLQHARIPCPSLYLRICSNSCPLSQWYHPTISSPVTQFSSYPEPFPASESFPRSWLFASDSQSIGTSASVSVLSMNVQGWFPLGYLVWTPCFPGDSQDSSPIPQFKSINSSVLSLLYCPARISIHDYW